ncbi:MAG TPA: HAD family phosphatase [Candidatus Saccharimonadales bacterium]|nr:HAD family phosphatase [Candidatus Saccharimonadales bacterium]
MKKFAVFDIDGTIFRWQLFSEIVFELINNGYIPKSAKENIDAKMAQWRSRLHAHSFHDYEVAIIEAFFPYVKNLPVASIEEAAEAVIARSGTHVYMYTRDLTKRLKDEGYTLVAISGSQDEIVQKFAQLWHFDIAIGQVHDSENDIYTGTIPGNKLLVLQKGDVLKDIVKNHGLDWKESVAVGDSRSDIAMLELVENPIAFNPNDDLFSAAQKHGWKIVIERKNMIYELEPKDGTYVLASASTR